MTHDDQLRTVISGRLDEGLGGVQVVATSVAWTPCSCSSARLRSSIALCSSGGGASRIGSDVMPGGRRDGLAVTTTTVPCAPASVAARSSACSDGEEPS
jgi:hypothetical protein